MSFGIKEGREDAERLTADVIELARQYARYGYSKIAALLRDAGWLVSDTRVERIWRRAALPLALLATPFCNLTVHTCFQKDRSSNRSFIASAPAQLPSPGLLTQTLPHQILNSCEELVWD
jgi:hypothetical protein